MLAAFELMQTLWRDDRGMVSSMHVILLYVILAFGAVVGLTAFRDQVVQEYGDVSVALDRLDQSYRVAPVGNCPGYEFEDESTLDDESGEPPGCIQFVSPTSEGT